MCSFQSTEVQLVDPNRDGACWLPDCYHRAFDRANTSRCDALYDSRSVERCGGDAGSSNVN